MSAPVVDDLRTGDLALKPASPAKAFDLTITVQRRQIRPQFDACISDDNCGTTCELSACISE